MKLNSDRRVINSYEPCRIPWLPVSGRAAELFGVHGWRQVLPEPQRLSALLYLPERQATIAKLRSGTSFRRDHRCLRRRCKRDRMVSGFSINFPLIFHNELSIEAGLDVFVEQLNTRVRLKG